MDVMNYTNNELEKQLNLLEIHLKQSPDYEEAFCEDCIRKHLSTIEGLAEEGIVFSDVPEPYRDVAIFSRKLKTADYVSDGIKLSQEVRLLRKRLASNDCVECSELFQSKSKQSKNPTKDLNNPVSSNKTEEFSHTNSQNPNKSERGEKDMISTKEIGALALGQGVGEAIRYMGVNYPKAEPGKYMKYGGVLLGAVATGASLYLLKKKPKLQAAGIVAGTNLLMGGISAYIAGAMTPDAPAARIGLGVSRVSSRLPALPTRRARGAILASPQARAYEAPMQAGLIRVD